MKLVLMLNVIDFTERLSKEFECEVILTEENNIDYLVFEQPSYELFKKIDDYIVKDEYVYVPLCGMKKYIKEEKNVEITEEYDFIETNLTGKPEEYLIYYL